MITLSNKIKTTDENEYIKTTNHQVKSVFFSSSSSSASLPSSHLLYHLLISLLSSHTQSINSIHRKKTICASLRASLWPSWVPPPSSPLWLPARSTKPSAMLSRPGTASTLLISRPVKRSRPRSSLLPRHRLPRPRLRHLPSLLLPARARVPRRPNPLLPRASPRPRPMPGSCMRDTASRVARRPRRGSPSAIFRAVFDSPTYLEFSFFFFFFSNILLQATLSCRLALLRPATMLPALTSRSITQRAMARSARVSTPRVS